MKVMTIVTRLNIGGSSPPVIALAAGLRARGHESILVTGTPERAEGSMNDDAVRAGAILQIVPSLRRNAHLGRDTSALLGLSAIMRRFRPDVVMTHLSKAGALGRVAARLARVPIIVHTYHGKPFYLFDRRWKEYAMLAVEQALARMSSSSIVVSAKQHRESVERGLDRPDRLKVIRYGLDLDRFAQPSSPARLREAAGLAPHIRLVGVVGRLVSIKGQDVFIQAAALAARLPDVHFVLVGDGERREVYEKLAHDSGLTGRVSFLGWRRDMPEVLAELDVVVLPTVNDFEGTPLAVIEALAAGRPVVATDVGGVAEVIRDGETGLLVAPRDAKALAAAIIAQLEDPGRAHAMADRGRRLVSTFYQRERMVDETEAWLMELLRRTREPATTADVREA